jgi:hypothetical protein
MSAPSATAAAIDVTMNERMNELNNKLQQQQTQLEQQATIIHGNTTH